MSQTYFQRQIWFLLALLKFLCHSLGRPYLEQTCLVLFQGYCVVVPLVLRRRIGLCLALQEQALALRQHLWLRLKGDKQPAHWPWKQTAGAAAVWNYHTLLWAGQLHCIEEEIIKHGDVTNKSTSRVNDTNVGPLGKGAVGTMVDPTNIVALVGQGQRTKNQLWCASCLTQDLWMASLKQ